MTEASLQVLEVLRSSEDLQWHVVPLIALVMFIYNSELEKKRQGEVYLGIYFLATSAAFAAGCHLLFAGVLGWV